MASGALHADKSKRIKSAVIVISFIPAKLVHEINQHGQHNKVDLLTDLINVHKWLQWPPVTEVNIFKISYKNSISFAILTICVKLTSELNQLISW